jgi:TonB family protein
VPEGVNDPDLICVVEWEILSDGTVKTPKVVKSTGTTEYDQRAIEAVEKTGNLGPLPSQFASKSLWVSLPFIFGQ